MSRFLEGLNDEQRHAVETVDGPLLVLAGAGTGKTRVITVRAAYLLERGFRPEQLLLATFTNKAAREMRERLRGLAGKAVEGATIGTFHSFCGRLLREHAPRLGLPRGFGICDGSDQQSLVKAALRELRIPEATVHPRAAHARISLFKNTLVGPGDALEQAADDWDELVARCYVKYEEALGRQRVVDFDDMLLKALQLLEQHEDIRAPLAERYARVMVDEYQDTNGPQYRIVRALAAGHGNLCVVGDDDQSIYGWRGADVRRILEFEKDFPGATVVRLETNYRSTEEILDAANKVIRNNPKRHGKTLRAWAGHGDKVRVLTMEDESHEAQYVAAEMQWAHDSREERWRDMAVLYRTATQARALEVELRSMNVPYRLVGGMSFFDRKEVRDLLAYLRLAANPHDETSFLRIVNVPPRGIGKGTVDKAVARATEDGSDAWSAFRVLRDAGELPAQATRSFTALEAALDACRHAAAHGRMVDAVHALVAEVDYRAEVDRAYGDDVTRDLRWNGVGELLDFAENHQRRAKDPTLESFLQELALEADDDRKDEDDDGTQDAVTLMTLHGAKGLEFPRVYLVGVEEGILPHRRSALEGSLDEERRLMYVGVTRAREVLTLSFCAQRAKFGKAVVCHPSRFLFEMKEKQPPDTWLPVEQHVTA